jgi:predicted SnoaL-like aldol condensation-catalyzing enzyme
VADDADKICQYFTDMVESTKYVHPNILSVSGLLTQGDIVYILTPWMANGTLREYCSKMASVSVT